MPSILNVLLHQSSLVYNNSVGEAQVQTQPLTFRESLQNIDERSAHV